jgi:nucleotide-binding universal stress UspA family protein
MSVSSSHAEVQPIELAAGPVDYEHLVVPLDGSIDSERALAIADRFALLFDASVVAVSVCDSELGRDQMKEYYERLVARTGRSSLQWQLPIENDEPGPRIVETAQMFTDPLICMASHGRGRLATSVLGSVARSVLIASEHPMIVAGPECILEEASEPSRIIACVDGSPSTATVLRTAAAWAKRLRTGLVILTVAEPGPPGVRDEQHFRRAFGPDVDATAYVNDLATVVRSVTGVSTEAHAVYHPIHAAAGVREFADAVPTTLIVVATHSRVGLNEIVLGSQAARIVHDAPAPVLVTPI